MSETQRRKRYRIYQKPNSQLVMVTWSWMTGSEVGASGLWQTYPGHPINVRTIAYNRRSLDWWRRYARHWPLIDERIISG